VTHARLSVPERLTANHDLTNFDCGEPSLNGWLVRMALKNEMSGASRTYVVCAEGGVVGYYCLANGAIDRQEAPRPMQRNMPDPIPVMVLGRLAVDLRFQNQKIGKALLRDAILRVLQAAEIAGIKAILVHAISEEARQFYLRRGFLESPINPMIVCLILETARQAIQE
jgi:GNAT superfamily N-acetyltransferase